MNKTQIENHFSGNYETFYDRYLGQLKSKRGDKVMAVCPFHDDHNPSLCIDIEKGLFNCFGCGASGDVYEFYAKLHNYNTQSDFPQILNEIAEEFGIKNGDRPKNSKVVARYSYEDESGKIEYQIERHKPKSFLIRRSDGNGGWIYNKEGVRILPYHLPDVIKAREVIIVEGEKDADKLIALGFIASTNPFGAGKWPEHFGSFFAGKDVALIPDNDDAGRQHMDKVAMNLKGHASSIKYLELPGLPEKGDVSDFIATFSSDEEAAEHLSIMIESAMPYRRPDDTSTTQDIVKSSPCLNDTTSPEPDPLNFPDIMAGAAGDFARVYSAHMEPPPHFFFMAYLACLGNIVAGRVALRTELSTETRIYLLILGASADDRKSTAINKTVSFFREAMTDFPICFGIGSAEGLQKKLEESNRLLLCFDEFRAFTSKCKIDGSVLLPCVTTLFESRDYESQTAKKSVIINGASLSIMAASTIDTYELIFDEHFLSIGFPNRVFLCPGKGQRRFSIPEKINDINRRVLFDQLGLLLKHIEQAPEIDIMPDARSLYDDWYMNLPQSLHTKRLDTYAMRFMVLLTINDLKDVVDVEIVRKVIALCNWQYEARKRYDPIDADSKMARAEEKIRRALSSGGKKKRDLERAVHIERIGIWIFDKALNNLVSAGHIELDKKSKLYRLI